MRRAHNHYSAVQDGQLVAECIPNVDLFSGRVGGGENSTSLAGLDRVLLTLPFPLPPLLSVDGKFTRYAIPWGLGVRMSRSLVFLGKNYSMTPSLRVGWGTTRYPGSALLGSTTRGSWMTGLPSPSVPNGPFPTRSPPMSESPWRSHARNGPLDLPDDGPECQDGDDHQSVDSDDSSRARWIIDSGTTSRIPVPKRVSFSTVNGTTYSTHYANFVHPGTNMSLSAYIIEDYPMLLSACQLRLRDWGLDSSTCLVKLPS